MNLLYRKSSSDKSSIMVAADIVISNSFTGEDETLSFIEESTAFLNEMNDSHLRAFASDVYDNSLQLIDFIAADNPDLKAKLDRDPECDVFFDLKQLRQYFNHRCPGVELNE